MASGLRVINLISKHIFHVQYCVYECTIPLSTVRTGRQRNHITDVQPHSKFHPAWPKIGLQHLSVTKAKGQSLRLASCCMRPQAEANIQ